MKNKNIVYIYVCMYIKKNMNFRSYIFFFLILFNFFFYLLTSSSIVVVVDGGGGGDGSLCISINFINNSISQKIIWTAPKENKKVSTSTVAAVAAAAAAAEAAESETAAQEVVFKKRVRWVGERKADSRQ